MDEPERETSLDPRIEACVKFVRRVSENDSVNRENARTWRKFRDGDQWPAEIQNSRTLERRPCITVNKTDAYCLHVENQQRQQRPRIRVDPTNGEASKKVADVIKGMIRHIESTRGGADMAYDTGFSGATTEGVGYWRVLSAYTSEKSFEQELFLEPIEDPLTVYFDDNSVMPDGSDAMEVAIVTDMAKEAFKEAYPGKDDGANFLAANQPFPDWLTKDRVRVAEYFKVKIEPSTLVKLSNGEIGFEDELKDKLPKGVTISEKRRSAKRTVTWCKVTALEVLDERIVPGKWIGVFPCYGRQVVIDGKRRRSGLIKNAMGPQQMSNFWKTAMTETVALAPKAKWVMAEGQNEGHENEWSQANNSATATLVYKQADVDGKPAPPPQRNQPEPPPEGAMAMAAAVDNDLSAVLGIIEPAQRIGGNVSGKALNAERLQSDQNTFHLYDNLTRSIAFTGRYLLDVMKDYYFEAGRVVRIVGDDGKSKVDTINATDPQDPQKVINDISVGQYDVVMDTGPGYNTKRQEAVDSMMPLFEKNEELMKTAGDVMFRNMDFPGAEVIADRLAAANPLSQVDDSSEVPPQAQTMIKGLQMQLKQAQGVVQQLSGELKSRSDVEAMKQAAESHRLDIKEAAQTQRNREDNEQWQHDIHTKAVTALNVAEINAVRELLKTKVNNEHDLKTLDRQAAQQDREVAEAATS